MAMEKDLALARAHLEQNGCTCVLCRDGRLLERRERGIRPLLVLLASGQDLRGYSAADLIVGKAAALLYVKMGVAAVYAQVLSKPGLTALQAHGIPASYGLLVDSIRNRADTGPCPMDAAVAEIDPAAPDAPDAAYPLLKRAAEALFSSGQAPH